MEDRHNAKSARECQGEAKQARTRNVTGSVAVATPYRQGGSGASGPWFGGEKAGSARARMEDGGWKIGSVRSAQRRRDGAED